MAVWKVGTWVGACVLMSMGGAGAAAADLPPERTFTMDPVALVGGQMVEGKPDVTVVRDGIEYHFSSAENKAAFEKEPTRYEAADGGACGRMGPLSGIGDARRFVVHDSRIYFFASDGCRDGFVKDPAKWIEKPDARPAGTAEADAAGRAAMDRLVAWAGGADTIRGIKTYQHSVSNTQKSGDKEWQMSQSFAARFPDQFMSRDTWDDFWYTTVRGPDGAAMASRNSHDVIADSRRAAYDRVLARSIVVFLRAYVTAEPGPDGGPVAVVHDQQGTVGDTPVDFVNVWMNGALSRLAIEQKTGRPVQLAFRGRDGTSSVGDVVRTYAAPRTVGGVQLPSAYSVTFNGKDLPAAAWSVQTFQINAETPDEWFVVKK